MGGHPTPGLGARCKPALPLPATRGASWLIFAGPAYLPFAAATPPRVAPSYRRRAADGQNLDHTTSTWPPSPCAHAGGDGDPRGPAAWPFGPRRPRIVERCAVERHPRHTRRDHTRWSGRNSHSATARRLWARWPRGADAGVCDRGSGSTPKLGLGACGPRHPERSPPSSPARPPCPRPHTRCRAHARHSPGGKAGGGRHWSLCPRAPPPTHGPSHRPGQNGLPTGQ